MISISFVVHIYCAILRSLLLPPFPSGPPIPIDSPVPFCSPLMIEDEVRRIDPQFNIAKIFLPLLALIKLFFGLMHIILKANSKEITKLLLTMIFLSAIVSHSNLNQDITFKDIYLSDKNTNPIDTNKPTNNVFTFLYGYIPYFDNLISQIPNILDTKHLGVGMTANVASLSIHSTNLIAYHWLIIIGVVSSICCHMVVYKDYSRIGRIGLGLFYILYGVSIMLLNEFQRPFIHTLTNYNIINNSMDNSAIIRIILIISFICCACGISLITNVKYKKLGIFISIGYILILISYETECLLIGQKKRQMYGITDINIDLKSMLKYHNKYIYPTDYQLLRIINLTMILSGNLFEMLKIYNPSKAESSQDDYSSVDDDDVDVLETNVNGNKSNQNNIGNGKLKNRKKNNKKGNNKKKVNKQNKSEPKKQK